MYTQYTITALLFILNGETISGHKRSNALQAKTEFFRLKYDSKPQRFNNVPDVSVLDYEHHIMMGPTRNLLACPATCTDQALCDCIRAYYNSEGDESCFSVLLSGCKDDKFASCYPVDDANEDHVGQGLAQSYLVCPTVECADSFGMKSVNENQTTAYACYCEGYASMCKRCYDVKDSVPYCNWVLNNYKGMCSDVIDCCSSETSLEGHRKCMGIVRKAFLENADKETPSNETAKSNVDSASKEETSGSNFSFGPRSFCVGVVVAGPLLFHRPPLHRPHTDLA
jgi:hypothetical protein